MATDNINDAKLYALRTVLGVTDGQTTQLEAAWLQSLGAVGESVNDLWLDYLTAVVGLPAGQLNDLQYKWLGDLGHTGSLPERFLAYWQSLIP